MPSHVTYSRRNMSMKPDISDLVTEVGSQDSASDDDDTPEFLKPFPRMIKEVSVKQYSPFISDMATEVGSDNEAPMSRKPRTRERKRNMVPVKKYSTPISDMTTEVGSLSSGHDDDDDEPDYMKPSPRMRSMVSSKKYSTPKRTPIEDYDRSSKRRRKEASPILPPPFKSGNREPGRYATMAQDKKQLTPKIEITPPEEDLATPWGNFKDSNSLVRNTTTTPPKQNGLATEIKAKPPNVPASKSNPWAKLKDSDSLTRNTTTSLPEQNGLPAQIDVKSLNASPPTSNPWGRLKKSDSLAGKAALLDQKDLTTAVVPQPSSNIANTVSRGDARLPGAAPHTPASTVSQHPPLNPWGRLKKSDSLAGKATLQQTSDLTSRVPSEEAKLPDAPPQTPTSTMSQPPPSKSWERSKNSASFTSKKGVADKDDLTTEVGIKPRSSKVSDYVRPAVNSGSRLRRRHAGPVSFATEDENSENLNTPGTVELPELKFDKFNMNYRSNTAKPAKVNIHGSQAEFMKTYGGSIYTKQNRHAHRSTRNGQSGSLHSKLKAVAATYKQSPKPTLWATASAMKKEQPYKHPFKGSGNTPSRGRALLKPKRLGTMLSRPSLLKANVRKAKTVKQPYTPKSNEVSMQPLPRTDILGRPLQALSRESHLWFSNQRDSFLLRLPTAILTRIYEQVLCPGTICISFPTFVPGSYKLNRYYLCETLPGHIVPFTPDHEESETDRMTLLSGVCRQLYHDTNLLPFEVNTWAFSTHNVMWNFVTKDWHSTPQQRAAIKTLAVREELPGSNLLEILPGVLEVLLIASNNQYGDWIYGPKWYQAVQGDDGPALEEM